jgi:hypothetical protein
MHCAGGRAYHNQGPKRESEHAPSSSVALRNLLRSDPPNADQCRSADAVRHRQHCAAVDAVSAGSGDGKTPIAQHTSVEVTTSGKSAAVSTAAMTFGNG